MKILGIVIAIVVVLGGTGAFVASRFKGVAAPTETAVRVEPVGRGQLVEIVTAPGQVQPKTKVQISARVAARIVDLPFDEGESVKQGDVLVKLDATELEAQLKATEARAAGQAAQREESKARVLAQEANIDALLVQLEDARRDLNRQRQLLEPGDVSQAIVDQAQARADQLAKQVEAARRQLDADRLSLTVLQHAIVAAEADIARARDNLNYTTITSPISGIVTRMNAKEGELVVTGTMNNAGTVIMEVSDLSEMQVDAQIDEGNIAAVNEGQCAKVRIAAYPDETFDGTVKLVGLDAGVDRSGMFGGGGGGGNSNTSGRWYRARVVLDTNGKRLRAGLSADVDVETSTHKDVIRVPTQAVLGRPIDELPQVAKDRPEVDKSKSLATVVYRFVDGKAVVTPVTIGASDMTHTLITSGLSDGDRIITGPFKALPTLAHDQKVTEDKSATTQSTTRSATGPATTRATTQP